MAGKTKDDPNIDWTSVDWWNKTTSQIAEEYNSTLGRVSARRRKYAPETVRTYKYTDWPSVDWSVPTKALVKMLGVDRSIIVRKRKALAPETVGYQNHLKERLKRVDWSNKSSSEIADEEGTTIYKISWYRKVLAPETLKKVRRKKNRRHGLSQKRGDYPADSKWLVVDWSKPTTQIAEEEGYSPASVTLHRRNLAPETVGKIRRIYRPSERSQRWTNVDWSLSNKEIAIQLNCGRRTVERQRKIFKGLRR